MKSLLLIFVLVFTQTSHAKKECRAMDANGNCEWIDVEEVDSLEITSENQKFDLFSPSTWIPSITGSNSNSKDKATREIRSGGKLQLDPGFDADEKNAPRRDIPDPSVLKKDGFKATDERLRDAGLTKSQKNLLERHSKLIDEVAAADTQARNDLSQMNTGLKNIHQELDPLDKSIEAASKEYQRCVDDQRDCGKSKANLLGKLADIERIREQRGPIVTKWNTSMNAYNKKLDEFESHNLKMNKELRPYMTDEGILRQQVANLQNDLRREEMTREFQDTRYALVDITDQLDDLERAYDTKRIGAYVQDKVGHLLTSDILCRITSTKCVNGENQATLGKGDLVEIFPTIETNNTSRGTYTKRKSRSIQSIPEEVKK